MNPDTAIRVLALCVVLAGAETLHGIARTVLIVPKIGKEKATKLGAITGSVLALLICFVLVPPIGLVSAGGHLALGMGLAAFMAAFDLAIGRFVMRKPWVKLWPDFNPATGNYLSCALAFLAIMPLLIHWWLG